MLRTVLAFMVALSLFSCATTKPVKEQPKPVEQGMVLPNVELAPEPKKEEKPPETKIQPVIVEEGKEEKYVILNFDDADIETVVTTMGDLLQINYILAPGVAGKVTIQSYKKFPVKDLFSIFQSILEMNGLTAVKNKDFYMIVPIDSARQQNIEIEKGKEVRMSLDSGFITQIVPLEYVKAADAVNLLRGLMPRGTDLLVYEPTNLLIVTARPEGILKFMKILEAIDIAPSDRENIRTFVYYAESGEAKKLAEILKDIFVEKGISGARRGATVPPPQIPAPRPGVPGAQAQPATSAIIGSTAGEIQGEITITAYEDINALIIKSSPAAYLTLLETLKKLDIPPKQVLIEVLIAEVTLGDDFNFGLEWFLKSSGDPTVAAGFTPSKLDVAKITETAPSQNLFAYVINPGKFVALLTALSSTSKFNVISSPHVLALDNKEAKIEIGDEIPIATGINTTAQAGTAATTSTTALVSTGQIQYRTAGTLITVTPHISDKNNVTLKISQEFSNLGKDVVVGGTVFPSFTSRKTQTTGIVQNGHTLVIGGLISENKTKTVSGVPFLSQIPILGYLFGISSVSTTRTELLVMVTPHVIRSQEEADAATKEFQEKVRTIKERLQKAGIEKDTEINKEKGQE
jgi:type II secretory pathway component GspD/PulD (secretin)